MSNPRPVAFFDFDGTLSRIRSGWQTVMADHMLEVLLGTAVAAAAHPALSERVADAIEGLSGRPTILQMEWLVAEVEQRAAWLARTAVLPRTRCRVGLAVAFSSRLIEFGARCRAARIYPQRAALLKAQVDHHAFFTAQVFVVRSHGNTLSPGDC